MGKGFHSHFVHLCGAPWLPCIMYSIDITTKHTYYSPAEAMMPSIIVGGTCVMLAFLAATANKMGVTNEKLDAAVVPWTMHEV